MTKTFQKNYLNSMLHGCRWQEKLTAEEEAEHKAWLDEKAEEDAADFAEMQAAFDPSNPGFWGDMPRDLWPDRF